MNTATTPQTAADNDSVILEPATEKRPPSTGSVDPNEPAVLE